MNTIQLCSDDTTLDHLSTLQLPTLPSGTPYLLKSLTDETIDFIELAAVIENFPGIAGKLISLANSAWSAPTSEVTSLEASCSRLGLGVVRSTSIALAVAAPFNPAKCPAFDLEYYWCSVLLAADAASRLISIAPPASEFEPATLRAAGLLHKLGLLWLADRLPNETDRALNLVKNGTIESMQQAFAQVFGYHLEQAGEHLGNQWGLPKSLVAAMAHYPETGYGGPCREIVITVGLATRLVSAALKQTECPENDSRQASLGISDENLKIVFAQVQGQAEKTREIAKILI